jgi:small basic protein
VGVRIGDARVPLAIAVILWLTIDPSEPYTTSDYLVIAVLFALAVRGHSLVRRFLASRSDAWRDLDEP